MPSRTSKGGRLASRKPRSTSLESILTTLSERYGSIPIGSDASGPGLTGANHEDASAGERCTKSHE